MPKIQIKDHGGHVGPEIHIDGRPLLTRGMTSYAISRSADGLPQLECTYLAAPLEYEGNGEVQEIPEGEPTSDEPE